MTTIPNTFLSFLKKDLPSALIFAAVVGCYLLIVCHALGIMTLELVKEATMTFWLLLILFYIRGFYIIAKWRREP